MRVSCLSFLTHSVSEHPMSDHVPTVPAPAVLPDGGGSVRVTHAKALRSSMSVSKYYNCPVRSSRMCRRMHGSSAPVEKRK